FRVAVVYNIKLGRKEISSIWIERRRNFMEFSQFVCRASQSDDIVFFVGGEVQNSFKPDATACSRNNDICHNVFIHLFPILVLLRQLMAIFLLPFVAVSKHNTDQKKPPTVK